MRKLVQLLNPVLRDQRGATAIEYGLIAALICIAIIGGVGSVRDAILAVWAFVSDTVLANS